MQNTEIRLQSSSRRGILQIKKPKPKETIMNSRNRSNSLWRPFETFADDVMGFSNQMFKSLDEMLSTNTNFGRLPIDIQMTETSIMYLIDLPGVKQEDIDISQEGYAITIRATRNIRNSQNSMETSFILSKEAKLDTLKASLADGVLTIAFDREKPAEVKKIRISSENKSETQEIALSKK